MPDVRRSDVSACDERMVSAAVYFHGGHIPVQSPVCVRYAYEKDIDNHPDHPDGV